MLIIAEEKFNTLVNTLKHIYGLIPIIIGTDKFFLYIVDWNIYISPTITQYLPAVIASNILPIVGVVEIIAGIIILSKYTRLGAYIVAAWLGAVIFDLLTIGMYDIALRDVAILIGYVTLGMLIEIKETARQQ